MWQTVSYVLCLPSSDRLFDSSIKRKKATTPKAGNLFMFNRN
ncbi:hypothetical protein [Okeania sp. SIO2C2]|nr:hypothetical protein [Okeania sp. SIO2C2]